MRIINESVKRPEFMVHGFMVEMGLKGRVLEVYALLYSFTKGARGMFYGTKKYLARALGMSDRTVYRALKRLKEDNLIETRENTELGIVGIVCRDLSDAEKEKPCQKEGKAEDGEAREEVKEERVTVPFWTDEKREAAYKRIISERLGRITPDEEALVMSEYREKSVRPKSTFLKLGKEGRVLMTEPQYKSLAEILNADQLHTYIERLERMLIRNDETGLRCSKAHYRVIKKWIEEDIKL